MRLLGSASLVLVGLIVILWVDGSIRGLEANTIGGVLLLLGFVSALLFALGAAREARAPRGDNDSFAVPRR
jgi:hypothetical protein